MWPGSPGALVDTRLCPSCFETLTATTCSHCGLVLADPRAARLLDLGDRMVDLEAERQKLIHEIRQAHSAAKPAPEPPPAVVPAIVPAVAPAVIPTPPLIAVAVAASVAAPSPVTAPVSAVSPPAPQAVAPEAISVGPPPSTPEPPAPSEPKKPRRRLTVPVLLLIAGVTLVGVAAIFFLVLAWRIADIGTRALIIGGITLATIVAASLLRRWALRATAEAIGALGVVLLGLDAWAVRANDLFGAAAVEPAVYAGAAMLVVGLICRVWSMVSGLRGPDLAAILALPAGLGLLIAGLLPVESSAAITAGFLGAAVGGLAHTLPAPWSAARPRPDTVLERTALAVIGVAALLAGAAATVFIGLESVTVQLFAATTVIILGAAYALLLRPRQGTEPLPGSPALVAASSAVAAAFAASLGWQIGIHYFDQPVYPDLIAPVVAMVVAVALDRRLPRGRPFLAPRIAAAVVAAGSVLMLFGFSASRAAYAISTSWTLWQTPVFVPATDLAIDAAVLAAITSVIAAALLFAVPTLDRPGLRVFRPIAGAVIVIIGALGTGIPVLPVAVAICIAAIALVALARGAAPAGWGTAAVLGAVTAFGVGLSAPWLWAIGVAVAVVVPIVARAVLRPNPTALVVLALAPVAVCAVSALIAPSALAVALDVDVDERAALALVQWVAAATLAAAVWLRLDTVSRTALAWASYGLVAVSFLAYLAEPAGAASGVHDDRRTCRGGGSHRHPAGASQPGRGGPDTDRAVDISRRRGPDRADPRRHRSGRPRHRPRHRLRVDHRDRRRCVDRRGLGRCADSGPRVPRARHLRTRIRRSSSCRRPLGSAASRGCPASGVLFHG